jgi:hypothetical protein
MGLRPMLVYAAPLALVLRAGLTFGGRPSGPLEFPGRGNPLAMMSRMRLATMSRAGRRTWWRVVQRTLVRAGQ